MGVVMGGGMAVGVVMNGGMAWVWGCGIVGVMMGGCMA